MILLIDNYDSFSYNLYQYIGAVQPGIVVKKNDEISVEDILALNPTHIILSPGPGYPKEAGITEEIIQRIHHIPILGVCLGHQAICEVFGMRIENAKRICHGKTDMIVIDTSSRLFLGLQEQINVGRYHSLAAKGEGEDLRKTAFSADGELMAVEHTRYPIFGVQFHPESIMTECGMAILNNFLKEEYL